MDLILMISLMVKIVWGLFPSSFQKRYITTEVVTHTEYTGIRLVYLSMGSQKEASYRSYIKWEIIRNADNIWLVIAITSYV